jgi:hypothetical protein
MRRFPRSAGEGGPMRGAPGRLFSRGPRTYRSGALTRGARKKICILPVDTNGAPAEAGRLVGDLLSLRLSASKDFDVVEAAAFRAGARSASIRSFRNVASTDLKALADKVGTPLFLRATIFSYRDVPPGSVRAFPELQLDLILTDVQSGRVLWAANHSRRGDDYEGLLLRGSITNMVTLADRVVSEMIAAEESARSRKGIEP